MEELETKVVELIEKFEQLAVDIAPDALELGLFVARVSAAQGILHILLAGIATFAFWKLTIVLMRKFGAHGGFTGEEHVVVPLAVGAAFSGAGIFVSGIVFFVEVSVWPFVGIFYPEAWIAKEILGL